MSVHNAHMSVRAFICDPLDKAAKKDCNTLRSEAAHAQYAQTSKTTYVMTSLIYRFYA